MEDHHLQLLVVIIGYRVLRIDIQLVVKIDLFIGDGVTNPVHLITRQGLASDLESAAAFPGVLIGQHMLLKVINEAYQVEVLAVFRVVKIYHAGHAHIDSRVIPGHAVPVEQVSGFWVNRVVKVFRVAVPLIRVQKSRKLSSGILQQVFSAVANVVSFVALNKVDQIIQQANICQRLNSITELINIMAPEQHDENIVDCRHHVQQVSVAVPAVAGKNIPYRINMLCVLFGAVDQGNEL